MYFIDFIVCGIRNRAGMIERIRMRDNETNTNVSDTIQRGIDNRRYIIGFTFCSESTLMLTQRKTGRLSMNITGYDRTSIIADGIDTIVGIMSYTDEPSGICVHCVVCPLLVSPYI